MNFDFLNNQMVEAMAGYMDRLSQRQQIVASNIANIDTPGYKTKDISFRATMQELMNAEVDLHTSRPGHISTPDNSFLRNSMTFETPGLIERADQNNVDIDRELLKLGETSFGYSLMTQLMRGKFRTLALSINEGKTV